ncbi:unnamed protein product [Microthlaspi erraticum]|uniref:Reverse transcriptase domain-containing protein n=1 Tax=Microthlaspi erraticum TaxID=1685480 RepID=A0A6D2JF08_9BRAS|nr:unnamed protein product [Microthlaspi erraticum]
MNANLTAEPTREEIREALFSIHPDKAPGPDGFSAGFFQSHWSVIGPKIVEEIKDILRRGQIPHSINDTHVRLIPKVPNPKTVAEYRPIALCNVYYKIISKILTRRLQPILPTIISENQTAFVPDRAISDNILITHETLHFLKNSGATKHCAMAVKTDMSKAYERLEWGFIVIVMERMCFHAKWINWVMQCIFTVSYAYLVNGAAQGKVTPHRGIRQGDPLSPFIFILCGEVLSGLCKNAKSNGSLPGISVSRGSPKINHLLFADDTMFFSKTNQKSCETLNAILRKYEEASGQQINLLKSSITFSKKTPPEIKTRVKNSLGINKEGGQGKYLGLPESFDRRKKDLFTLIVDRIKQRSISYSSRHLSSAGKLTMIKFVLSSIPSYTMSCFKLPTGLCKRIQSAITRFWWDSKPGKKKLCWLAWSKLTRAKKNGGLGFREIQSFNDALLAKISWRILNNPTCLLSQVLKGKYCKDHTFINVQIKSSTSHGWRGILIGRDLIKHKLGRAIGNGQTTSLWNDPWLSIKHPTYPIGPTRKEDLEMTVSNLLTGHLNEWNITKIMETLPFHMAEIRALRPSSKGATDTYIWLPTKTGDYSVKTGYHVAMEVNENLDLYQNHQGISWMTEIWNARISPKMKVFLWKIVQEVLPVGDNLLNCGILDNACCVHCGDLETTEHLFFHCGFAKEVWNQAPFTKPINPLQIDNFTTTLTDSKTWICLPPTGITAGPLFSWICWAIWKARNHLLFEQRKFSSAETMSKAVSEARDWQQAQRKTHLLKPRSKTPSPNQTNPNTITCFTDGAWSKEHEIGGLGWIFIDADGTTRNHGHAAERFVSSPIMTEALAIRSALNQALESEITHIHIKTDAQEFVRAINMQEQIAEIFGILFDIQTLVSMFLSISFSYIPRSENAMADSIAKNAKSRLVTLVSNQTLMCNPV